MYHAGFRDCSEERGWLMRAVRLLRSWWRADRVRLSPGEGRLLRLGAPCILRFGGRYVQVMRRRTGQTPGGPYVCYECEVDGQTGELWVEPTGERLPPRVAWREGGVVRVLAADEVEVFG